MSKQVRTAEHLHSLCFSGCNPRPIICPLPLLQWYFFYVIVTALLFRATTSSALTLLVRIIFLAWLVWWFRFIVGGLTVSLVLLLWSDIIELLSKPLFGLHPLGLEPVLLQLFIGLLCFEKLFLEPLGVGLCQVVIRAELAVLPDHDIFCQRI